MAQGVSIRSNKSGDKDGAFTFLALRRPCCRKSCSTVHNPMFHQKRFQGSVSGEKPTAHYSAVEQAKEERKQEKVQVEQKLDTLSAGLLNMLQAAQQQMDAEAVEAPVAGSPEAVDSPASDAPERRSAR